MKGLDETSGKQWEQSEQSERLNTMANEIQAYDFSRFRLKPRYRWFSASDRAAPDGWLGPHKSISGAVIEFACEYGWEVPCFVAQGRKMTKAEIAESAFEYEWEIDEPENAMEIRLPQRA